MTVEATTEKRRPGRPRNETYDDSILDATMAILLEDGYPGLTIDGVAARANVGRPTIYRRWSSKPALVVAALARSTGLAPAPDTGSLRGDLLAVQDHQVTLMNSNGFRRITPGLVADLTADPELAETYLSDYIAPRTAIGLGRIAARHRPGRTRSRHRLRVHLRPAHRAALLPRPRSRRTPRTQ